MASRSTFSVDIRANLGGLKADLDRAAVALNSWASKVNKALKSGNLSMKNLSNATNNFTKNVTSGSKKQAQAVGSVQREIDRLNDRVRAADTIAQRFAAQFKADLLNLSNVFVRRLTFSVVTFIERVFVNGFRKIIDITKQAIEVGSEFEDQILKTAAVAAGGVENLTAFMAELGGTAREVATTTIFTATEVASAMFELVSIGLSVSEVQEAIAASASFAAATQSQLSEATNLVTLAMKAFGLEGSQLTEASDVFVTAINTTTLTVDRLTNAMKFAAPAGGAFGQSLTDVVGVVAGFVDVTKQGGISGRAFRFLLQSLASPTEKAKSKIRELGIELEEVDPRLNRVTDIIRRFAFSMTDAGDAVDVFGRRAGPVVASFIERFRINFAVGIDTMEEFSKSVDENAGIAQRQSEVFLGSVTNQFKILVSQVTELGIRLFFSIRDSIGRTLQFLNNVVGNFVIRLDLVEKAIDRVRTAVDLLKVTLTGLATLKVFSFLASGAIQASQSFGIFRAAGFSVAGSLARVLKVGTAVFLTTTKLGKFIKGSFVAVALSLLIDALARASEKTGGLSRTMEGLERAFPSLTEAVKSATSAVINFITNFDLATVTSKTVQAMISAVIAFAELKIAIEDMNPAVSAFNKAIGQRAVVEQRIENLKQLKKDLADNTEETNKAALAQEAFTQSGVRLRRIQSELRKSLNLFVKDTEDFNEKQNAVIRSFGLARQSGASYNEALFALQGPLKDLDRLSEEYGETLGFELNPIVAKLIEALKALAVSGISPVQQALENLGATTKEEVLQNFADLNAAFNSLTDSQILKFYKDFTEEARETGLILDKDVREAVEKLQERLIEHGITVGTELPEEWGKFKDSAKLESGEVGSSIRDNLIEPTIDFFDRAREAFGFLSESEVESSIDEFTAQIIAMRAQLDETSERAVAQFVSKIQEMAVVVATNAKEIDRQDFLGTLLRQLEGIKGLDLSNIESLDQLITKLDEFQDASEESADTSESAFTEFFEEIQRGFGRAIADMIFNASSFADFMEDLFKGLVRKLVTDVFAGLFASMEELTGDSKSNLDGFAGDVEEIFRGIFGDAGTAKKVISGFGAFFASVIAGMETSVESALAAIASAIAFGFSIGGPIGAAVAAGVATLGFIIGTLFKDETISDIQDGARRLFGPFVDVSEELAEQIAKLADELGSEVAAIALSFAEIVQESGLDTLGELRNFTFRIRNIFSAVDEGLISAAEAAREFNEVLGDLIQGVAELGDIHSLRNLRDFFLDLINRAKTGIFEMREAVAVLDQNFQDFAQAAIDTFGAVGGLVVRDVINALAEAGIQVQAVTDFLLEQARVVQGALNPILEILSGRVLDLVDKHQELTDKVFDAREEYFALNAELLSLKQELASLDPNLASNKDRIAELKREIKETESEMSKLANQISRWNEKLGRLEERLDFGTRAQNDFIFTIGAMATEIRSLINSGISIVEIIEIFGDDLATAARLADEFNIKLPPMIRNIIGLMDALADTPRIRTLIESLGNMSTVMQSFLDKGLKPTVRTFEAFEDRVKRTFRRLRENTELSDKQIAKTLRPQLLQLAQLSALWGFELDKATENMLEAAGIDFSELEGEMTSLKDVVEGIDGGFREVINALLFRKEGNVVGALIRGPNSVVGALARGPNSVVGQIKNLIGLLTRGDNSLVGGVNQFSDAATRVANNAVNQFDRIGRAAIRTGRRIRRNLPGSINIGGAPDFHVGGVVPNTPSGSMLANVHSGEVIGPPGTIVNALKEALGGADISGGETTVIVKIGETELRNIISRTIKEGTINGTVEVNEASVSRFT